MASTQIVISAKDQRQAAGGRRRSVSYSPERKAEKKAVIIRALQNGWSARRIKIELVTVDTLKRWKDQDLEFAEAYNEAVRVRGIACRNEKGKKARAGLEKQILTAARAGVSFAQIKRTICPEWKLNYLRKIDPEFGAQLLPLGAASFKRHQENSRCSTKAEWANLQQHLVNGVAMSEGCALTGIRLGAAERRMCRDPVWARPVRNAQKERAWKRRQATVRFLGSHQICELPPGAILLSISTARRLLHTDPTFAAEIKNERTAERPHSGAEARSKVQSSEPVLRAAMMAVPSSLPPDVRDDIIGGIVLAVLSGDFGVGDIPQRAKEFVTAYWRGRPDYHSVSLDAPLYNDGSSTLHDVVSRSLWQE